MVRGRSFTPEEVNLVLSRILSSDGFANTERHRRFLQFITETAAAGDGSKLDEHTLAVEVFGRRESFDPYTDAIVRVEACRLRKRLQHYFQHEGRDEPIIVEIPKGSYAPVFFERPSPATPEASRRVSSAWPPITLLRWPAVAVLSLAVLLSAGHSPTTTSSSFLPVFGPELTSVAVLPFADISSERKNEFFTDGLTEGIISDLAGTGGLRVVSRTSVLQFKGAVQDLRQVGARLGVETVLEGTVRSTTDRLRIDTRLVDASNGYQLWAETYERDDRDALGIQDEIAHAIVTALKLCLLHGRTLAIGKRYTDHASTFSLYLQGTELQHGLGEAGLRKSVEKFTQAIAGDPDFAPGYVSLAESWTALAKRRMEAPSLALPKAQAAAARAVALDAQLAEAHLAMAELSVLHDWDWPAAEREFRRALEIKPSDPALHAAYAMEYLIPQGRFADGLTEIRKARSFDRFSTRLKGIAAQAAFFSRRYDDALDLSQRVLQVNPPFRAPQVMASTLIEESMYSEAVAFLHNSKWTGSAGQSLIGYAHGLMGRRTDAERVLRSLIERSKRRFVAPDELALVYIGLGEKSMALDQLERARAEHSPGLIYLAVDPKFHTLKTEPRFIALLESIGLAAPR